MTQTINAKLSTSDVKTVRDTIKAMEALGSVIVTVEFAGYAKSTLYPSETCYFSAYNEVELCARRNAFKVDIDGNLDTLIPVNDGDLMSHWRLIFENDNSKVRISLG